MSSREAKCVIIVHGGYSIRAGMGLHDLFQKPSVTLNARVGLSRAWLRQRRKAANGTSSSAAAQLPPPLASDYLVGQALDDALTSNASDIIVYRPLQGSHIADWQQVIALWRHLLFDLLRIKRSRNDSHTLLALPAPIHRDTYTTVAQIFFEQLNAPALSIVETPLVSAFAAGTLTAVTVDVGWAGCTITPVVDSEVRREAVVRTRVGTRLCTVWLAHILAQDTSIVQELGRIASSWSSSSASSAHPTQFDVQNLLVELAQLLLDEGHIQLTDDGDQTIGGSGADDDGNLDIAAALVQGREKDLVEEQERKRAAEAVAASAREALNESGDAATTSAEKRAAAQRKEEEERKKTAGQPGGSTDPQAVTVAFHGRRITVGPSRFRFAEPMLSDPTLLHSVKLPHLQRQHPRPPGAESDPDTEEEANGFGASVHEGERIAPGLLSAFQAADDEEDASEGPQDGTKPGAPQSTFTAALSLPEAIALAIQRTVAVTLGNAYVDSSVPFAVSDRRLALWENLVVTGAPTRIRGFTPALTAACGLYVSGAAQGQGGFGAGLGGDDGAAADAGGVGVAGLGGPGGQPRNVRALRTPDYFAEYKDRTDLAPFLGASIYTKLTLGNPAGSTFISKEVYNDRGPTAFFSVLPAS